MKFHHMSHEVFLSELLNDIVQSALIKHFELKVIAWTEHSAEEILEMSEFEVQQ
jgi:hypothetical protein